MYFIRRNAGANPCTFTVTALLSLQYIQPAGGLNLSMEPICISMSPETRDTPCTSMSRYCIVARSMEPKKRKRDRQWKNRSKVSPNLSKDFPWEVVLRFLKDHYRSLILLQMVDKNLNHLISTDNKLWLSIFNREIRHTAYCIRSIRDPIFPNLRLWKPHLTGLPVYTGPLRGDHDDSSLGSAFDACFSSYVRRVFALKFGTRCGLCGCRHRHEVYWSLRKRVCRLCMENNTISGEALSRKYGVDYSDMLLQHKGKFFFYTCSNPGSDDRVSLHGLNKAELHLKNPTYMFWLPHLKTFLDLPSLYKQQNERRQAAILLTIAVKRRWNLSQRHLFATAKINHSIDCLLHSLYRNEKKRLTSPFGVVVSPGGPNWAFNAIKERSSKFTLRNKESVARLNRLMLDYEDCVV